MNFPKCRLSSTTCVGSRLSNSLRVSTARVLSYLGGGGSRWGARMANATKKHHAFTKHNDNPTPARRPQPTHQPHPPFRGHPPVAPNDSSRRWAVCSARGWRGEGLCKSLTGSNATLIREDVTRPYVVGPRSRVVACCWCRCVAVAACLGAGLMFPREFGLESCDGVCNTATISTHTTQT